MDEWKGRGLCDGRGDSAFSVRRADYRAFYGGEHDVRAVRTVSYTHLKARENGFGVIIAAAGKAAHLAGVLAAHTTLPVIGIPVKSSTLDGLDALLATVQMPSGIPVATVAIDGAKNAALLAVQMLALSDEALSDKLMEMKMKMNDEVIEKDKKLQLDMQM